MIKGSQLIGRAVIDMDAAERMGKIKDILVQRDGERVAGFLVGSSESLLGSSSSRRLLPASALNAIGPDAVTVRSSATSEQGIDQLEALPSMSDITGLKMVTRSGRVLGDIDDMLIDPTSGRIVGFTIGAGVRGKLESFFSPESRKARGYVRADADLQVGNELVVVPDEALIEGEPQLDQSQSPASGSTAGDQERVERSWQSSSTEAGSQRSVWRRRSGTGGIPSNTPRENVSSENAMRPKGGADPGISANPATPPTADGAGESAPRV